MKIRTGFVSNSSSSSFVVKGFIVESNNIDKDKLIERILTKFPSIQEKINKCKQSEYYDEYEAQYYETRYGIRDNGLYLADCEEDGAPKNCTIFGKLLEDTEYELSNQIIDYTIDENMQEIQDMLKSSLKEEVELPVKVIIGTRMC